MAETVTITTSDLLSVQDTARQLGRPRLTIYRWIKKGKIAAIRLGGTLYVPKSELEKLTPVGGKETNEKA